MILCHIFRGGGVLWKSGREQRSREIRDVVVVCFSACQFKLVIWQATGRGTLFSTRFPRIM
jgi:hypothetical protein